MSEDEAEARHDVSSAAGDRPVAVFIDAENVYTVNVESLLGQVLDRAAHVDTAEQPVLMRAYADWTNPRFAKAKSQLGRLGVEQIHVKAAANRDPSAADIHLAVDAVAESFRNPPIETFVIVSGDGGLTPLVERLRADGRSVVGVGRESSTSSLLQEACDEFFVFVGKGVEHPIRRTRRTLPDDWQAADDAWMRAVRHVADDLLAESHPVSLPLLINEARTAMGLGSFREASGFANQADAVAEALLDSPIHLYRMPDRLDVWLLDDVEHLPEDALLKSPLRVPEELPAFLGLPSGDLDTIEPGPVVGGAAAVSRLVVPLEPE